MRIMTLTLASSSGFPFANKRIRKDRTHGVNTCPVRPNISIFRARVAIHLSFYNTLSSSFFPSLPPSFLPSSSLLPPFRHSLTPTTSFPHVRYPRIFSLFFTFSSITHTLPLSPLPNIPRFTRPHVKNDPSSIHPTIHPSTSTHLISLPFPFTAELLT